MYVDSMQIQCHLILGTETSMDFGICRGPATQFSENTKGQLDHLPDFIF